MTEHVTYGDLSQIVRDVGFTDETAPGSHTVYRHARSDTLILLAPHAAGEVARPIDVKYIRRVLDEKGLLDGEEFDRRIAAAYASHMA
jgi:predicted RNA binding protein YcfA (HicA-like mRNA interferase family)